MRCPQCQTENDAGARFCEDCGARLEATCPSCGTPVTPGKKFCRSCGGALTAESAGRFASPEPLDRPQIRVPKAPIRVRRSGTTPEPPTVPSLAAVAQIPVITGVIKGRIRWHKG
jgi:hypothetical protein